MPQVLAGMQRKKGKNGKTGRARGMNKGIEFHFHPGHALPKSILEKEYESVESKTPPNSPIKPHLGLLGGALLKSNHNLAMGFMGFTPLPSRLHAKLKYVSPVTLTSGVTPGVHVFSANGCYDPDITGTGHQPRGFDQLIALYDHYVVLKSQAKVEYMFTTGSSVSGIQLQSSSVAQSDYIDYAEQARCDFAVAPRVITTGGVPEPLVHTMHFGAKEFMGIPDPITADKLQGTVSANPSDQAYYHIWMQSYDGSSAATQNALVIIEYDVVFIEPVPVASS
jgi:hypothetical protein